MTPLIPPIDIVLHDFFATARDGTIGRRRDRIDRFEEELRAFLEREGPCHVCHDCQAVIALERQFGSRAPFARIMLSDLLVVLLRLFLERAAAAPDLEQRRVEARLVDGLARYLNSYRLFDPREFLIDFVYLQSAVLTARQNIRRIEAQRRAARAGTALIPFSA